MARLSLPDKWRDEDDPPPSMNVAVIVSTCGDTTWADMAKQRAYPSARAATDGRPRCGVVLRHYPELTLAQARNAAARETNAEWLCFLDADDELESGYLEAMDDEFMRGAITKDWSPLLAPALRRVWNNDLRSSTRAEIPNRGRWPQINECVIGTLVKADMFQAVGGFRDFTDEGDRILMYEDWHLWLRCWNSGAQIVHVDEAVYREHVNDKGRNTNAHLAIQVYDAIWRDHERDLAVLRGES